jgi:cytochrome c biogenesis protein CcmG, thiol:disulfide interchange protein DsbE
MKKVLLALLFSSLGLGLFAQNQIPKVEIKSIDGNNFNTSNLANDGKPFVISFWATWCKPCVSELSAIAENYTDWNTESGFKVYAVSIDDARNTSKVAPFVNGKAWPFEVLMDPNSDLRRAMNVNNVPHTFMVNSKGEIIYSHNSYAPGDEEHLYEEFKKELEKK